MWLDKFKLARSLTPRAPRRHRLAAEFAMMRVAANR